MGLILTEYDLSGGKTTSSEVSSPNNWRVTVRITGESNNNATSYHFEIEDSTGYWAPLTDDRGQKIGGVIVGNGISSINAIAVNAANGRISVVPSSDSVGECNIDSINA